MNVLDVMDHAIRCVHQGASPEHAAWHAQLTEARAAVAELIEAVSDFVEVRTHNGPRMHYDPLQSDRIAAALARVGAT